MAEPLRIQFERVNGVGAQPVKPAVKTNQGEGTSFEETLQQVQDVRFSNHAQKRLESREITLNEDKVGRLADAIDKVEKRGGKSSLVLMDDLAFVVNVRERMVVTAVDANHRGEGVFTQIDSVVIADPSGQSGKINVDRKG